MWFTLIVAISVLHIVNVCVFHGQFFQREIRETVLSPFRNFHRFVLNEREWKLIQWGGAKVA